MSERGEFPPGRQMRTMIRMLAVVAALMLCELCVIVWGQDR